MIKLKFNAETLEKRAIKESKWFTVYLIILATLILLAMVISLPFTERSFVVDTPNILLLIGAFLIGELVILVSGYILYKYFIYTKKDYNSAVEIEIGDDYIIRHVNVQALNLINQFAYKRGQIRMIKEISNKKISFDDIYKTTITKKGIKFYTAGPNGVTVFSTFPNYQEAVEFVNANKEKLKLVS